jgi:hypothetical protein
MSIRRTAPRALAVLAAAVLAASCAKSGDPRLAGASREDINGWVVAHLSGPPEGIGFQHGWLLAPEIDDVLKTMAFYLEKATGRNWDFFRGSAEEMLWPKLGPEYRAEIEGIAAGVKARLPETSYDPIDITALNGWIELAWYYVPWLDKGGAAGPGAAEAPPYCSAFIATGSYTADGRIVMGHNSWVEYIIGERWNAVLDIRPETGARMVMDAIPGTIHSGDDFVINERGIVYTETTISKFKGFRPEGTPEFMRARQAAQYAETIDDFIRIMSADNNGGYANDWLVGDIKTGEIARLELGLKSQPVWRTKDGCYFGSNAASDPAFIAAETDFDPNDAGLSVLVRRKRWEGLIEANRGKIDAETAKAFESDHLDASTGAPAANGNVLCGHVDTDPKGLPEFDWPPYFPGGSVQGKVTTASLAERLAFWGRMGHPCGRDFIAADYFAAHPEAKDLGRFLRDMPAHPWTLFAPAR